MSEYMVRIAGQMVRANALAERLTMATPGAATQNCVANAWQWFWSYQVPLGNALGFKALREARYAFTMTLLDAATTAMPDATLIRLVEYYADGTTTKRILLNSTYGVLHAGSGTDITQMLHIDADAMIDEGNILRLEQYHLTATFLAAGSVISLGATRYARMG